MHRITLAASLLLFAVSAWGQAPQPLRIQPPKIVLESTEVRLPMGSRGGRITVEAKINGKGPYHFYFDTGASGAVMRKDLATELKLEVIGQAGVKSGGDAEDKKPIAAEIVRADEIQLGSVKLSGVTIVAMDRSRLGGADAPAGVLSPAMFPGYLVSLDYPKKEIRFRAGSLGEPDNKTLFPYLENRPIPSLMATIGSQEIEAHLDTGSGQGLSLPVKLAEKLPLNGKLIDTGKKARSVSGDFPVFEGKLNGKLSFGQFTFNDPTIEFSDIVRHANLGARVLERFVLTIDIKNRRFQMVDGK